MLFFKTFPYSIIPLLFTAINSRILIHATCITNAITHSPCKDVRVQWTVLSNVAIIAHKHDWYCMWLLWNTVAHRINTKRMWEFNTNISDNETKNQVSILLQHRTLFKLAWHWKINLEGLLHMELFVRSHAKYWKLSRMYKEFERNSLEVQYCC